MKKGCWGERGEPRLWAAPRGEEDMGEDTEAGGGQDAGLVFYTSTKEQPPCLPNGCLHQDRTHRRTQSNQGKSQSDPWWFGGSSSLSLSKSSSEPCPGLTWLRLPFSII